MRKRISVYFSKSLEEDFATKTLRGNKKVDYQSIDNILKTKTIRPNTRSFGQKRRLSTTILTNQYTKTYRPQGIIFETTNKPDYILPFDLVVLTGAEKIIVHYYRIKNDLHLYYNHDLMAGFERFVFKDLRSLLKTVPSPQEAWRQVNSFRVQAGLKGLPLSKFRLVEYNEAVFHQPVSIQPIAIYGYRKEAREVAKRYGLPHFTSAKAFYQSIKA